MTELTQVDIWRDGETPSRYDSVLRGHHTWLPTRHDSYSSLETDVKRGVPIHSPSNPRPWRAHGLIPNSCHYFFGTSHPFITTCFLFRIYYDSEEATFSSSSSPPPVREGCCSSVRPSCIRTNGILQVPNHGFYVHCTPYISGI